MGKELVVFACFGGLAIVFNHIEANLHRVVPRNIIHRIIYHETTLHAIRDYAIHFMIYSGYVLGH